MNPCKDMVFLGMAKLLSECSPHVTEDLRDRIEDALSDVVKIDPGLRTFRENGKVFLYSATEFSKEVPK